MLWLMIQATNPTTVNIAEPGLREAALDDAAVTIGNNYMPNLALSKDAIVLACRPPAVPSGGGAHERIYVTDEKSMLVFEIAIYRQYRQVSMEVGCCWGVKTISPRHIALLLG